MKPTAEQLEAQRPAMHRIAFNIVQDHHIAEDMASDAIVEALEKHDIRDLDKWLARVVRNKSLDWMRSFSIPAVEEIQVIAPEPPEEVDVLRIEKVLQQMPTDLRTALAGIRRNMSVSTFRRHRIEARAEFKRLWELDD